MAPTEILLSLFWIASALLAAMVLILLFLKDSAWAARVSLGLSATAFLVLFGLLLSAGLPVGEMIQKRVTWAGGGGGIPAVEIGMSFSAGSALLLLVLACIPLLALSNPGIFKNEVRSERQLVALLPLLAAVIFGLFAAGFWSTAMSGGLVLIGMSVAFSSQWELVGESQAMERSLRDFLMGLLLACFSRFYFLSLPAGPILGLVFLAALLFSRVGPFAATGAQELLAQGTSWRRLILEWMPRITGTVLISLLLFESGTLAEGPWLVAGLAAFGLLLSLVLVWPSASAARTSAGVLAGLGIWGIVVAATLGVAHFKIVYLWLFLSGWSVLSVQDLLRAPQDGRPKVAPRATIWVRIALCLLTAVLLGAPGWMSGTLFLAVFQAGMNDVGAQVGIVMGYLLYALVVLTWVVRAWRESRQQSALTPGLALPLLTSVLFLALLWDGSLTGGWLEDAGAQMDQVAGALLSNQFGLTLGAASGDARVWMLVVMAFAGIIVAILMRGGLDRAAQGKAQAPGFFRFVEEGLGCERAADQIWLVVAQGGRRVQSFWSDQVLERGVYRLLHLSAQQLSRWGLRTSERSDAAGVRFLDALFRAPALMAQSFQGGDLRWYLFWGILISSLILLRQGWFVR